MKTNLSHLRKHVSLFVSHRKRVGSYLSPNRSLKNEVGNTCVPEASTNFVLVSPSVGCPHSPLTLLPVPSPSTIHSPIPTHALVPRYSLASIQNARVIDALCAMRFDEAACFSIPEPDPLTPHSLWPSPRLLLPHHQTHPPYRTALSPALVIDPSNPTSYGGRRQGARGEGYQCGLIFNYHFTCQKQVALVPTASFNLFFSPSFFFFFFTFLFVFFFFITSKGGRKKNELGLSYSFCFCDNKRKKKREGGVGKMKYRFVIISFLFFF